MTLNPAITVAALAIAMRLGGDTLSQLSYAPVAVLALLGPKQAIQALAMSWFLSMINPALGFSASSGTAGRYLVIAAAAASVTLRRFQDHRKFYIRSLSLATVLFGAFILTHSLFVSSFLDVSILKATSWCVVVLTLLAAWQLLSPEQHAVLFRRLEQALIALVLVSAPLLLFPGIGYFRNGYGFQGLLNHPQTFGPIGALAAALVGGRILIQTKPSWLSLSTFLVCIFLMIASKARTAGLAIFAGMLVTVVLVPYLARTSRLTIMPGLRSRRLHVVLIAALGALILSAPLLMQFVSVYLFKGSDTVRLADAAVASRGMVIERMISNIQERPWTGIGFGVASEPESFVIERDALLGLPLSAPVEKGVLPLAVVEELGLFGLGFLMLWILLFLKRGALAGAKEFAAMATILLINLGENVFFSVGGLGLILLILFTGAATINHQQRATVSR